jgi:phosphoribosyl 1,2-cyclic phosphate phosphodiesterase
MKPSYKITVLGSGASTGIPVIGCTCAVCSSLDSKNKRLRSSIKIEKEGKILVIDAGPDFRAQALLYKINKLDALVLTHAHFDHIAGIDEVRIYNFIGKKPVPCLMTKATYEDFAKSHWYLLGDRDETMTKAAKLDIQVTDKVRGKVSFAGFDFDIFTYSQAHMQVMGLRFGKFAYVTDIKNYPETIFEDLRGVEVLIVSALKKEASPVHFNLEEATAFSRKVGAKKTYITHIAHEMDHNLVDSSLEDGIHLSYDGLTFEV